MAKGNLTITPDALAKNWQQGVTNNVKKAQDSVNRMTENPMAKAAEAVDRQVAGVQAAAASGKTQAALLSVDFATWKSTTVSKMGERMAGGATTALPKMTRFAQYLIPTVNAGKQAIANMPRLTIQDSKNRMVAWVDHMHANPYKK